jgi:hypothetical protein
MAGLSGVGVSAGVGLTAGSVWTVTDGSGKVGVGVGVTVAVTTGRDVAVGPGVTVATGLISTVPAGLPVGSGVVIVAVGLLPGATVCGSGETEAAGVPVTITGLAVGFWPGPGLPGWGEPVICPSLGVVTAGVGLLSPGVTVRVRPGVAGLMVVVVGEGVAVGDTGAM